MERVVEIRQRLKKYIYGLNNVPSKLRTKTGVGSY